MRLHPLSKPQSSIWNMEQYFGGSIANITASVLLTDPVNQVALNGALNNMLEQCDSLRIRITSQQGIPMQQVRSFTPQEFETKHFPAKPELTEWATALARKPFDINGDLYKFYIIFVDHQPGFILHLHHLTADAWTLSFLIHCVLDYLDGIKPDTNSYLDYLTDEQDYESSMRRMKDKQYFLSVFEKCSEPVYFNDRQLRQDTQDTPVTQDKQERQNMQNGLKIRSAQQKSTESKRLSFTLNASDTDEIMAFCGKCNISPFAMFLNTFATYLYRIKGAQDFFIGTTIINRATKKEKNTAGMFINTVPIRFHIDDEKSTLENIQNTTVSLSGAFRHQKYPISDFLTDIRETYGFTEKLFDVTLNFQNAAISGNADVAWHFCGCQGESLNIHINDRNKDGAFHFDYDYQTESFNTQDITRLHSHLKNLILDTISNPGKKPQELRLLSGDEYQQVVFDFNNTTMDYPREKCIHQLFEEQAANIPDKIAVIFEGQEYTYRQINDMANALADILRKKGVRRNDIVPIIAKRSYKIIVAQLAVLKAGGAYMPIDPNYPKERIDFMLSNAKCRTTLVLGATIGTTAAMTDKIDLADDSNFDNHSAAVENINTSDDICYVIYTSGSTGTPKGTMITHRNFVNFLSNNLNIHYAIKQRCTAFLCVGSFIFDIASAEVFLALLNRYPLIFSSDDELERPDRIAHLIEYYKADFVLIVPTRILSYMNNRDFAASMQKLKVLSFGGERLTPDTLNKLRFYTKAVILNGYGPAETTQGCSLTSIDNDITIGKPVANAQIYILDKHHNPMPIGAVGELCISGDGVGLGYLNNPELTAKKFIANPFIEGSLMYMSGDLARFFNDGRIDFIGRMDHQVKIRGLRIELGEIETAILAFPGVQQVVVTEKKDGSGRQYLCAYYISDEDLDEKSIRAQIAKKLPRYMIPHFFVRLASFPATPSGKTDLHSLPAPDFLNTRSNAKYVAPCTAEEKTIVTLMQQVLNVPKIGLNDNFFDLGGDSLKAIEFVSKAHYLGIHISLQDVFDAPTTAQLPNHQEYGNRQPVQYCAGDFASIHKLIKGNQISNNEFPEKHSLGTVLITGATGWLGAHVLDAFLSIGQSSGTDTDMSTGTDTDMSTGPQTGTAYCLVRGSGTDDSSGKLNTTLENYFGGKYRGCDKIKVLCGDITENITLKDPIDTIFHCAANVKHFGSQQQSHFVNVTGTENVIALAREKKARLFHISTSSVSGSSFDSNPDTSPAVFNETTLYIGQQLSNIYVRSKFDAETAVLQAKMNGVDTAVIRVGNLANRSADYRFQRNHETNATLTRLKAFIDLGMFPEELAAFPLEFSPVDDTAKAIIRLAQYHNDKYSVFHAYHHKSVRFIDFANAAQAAGLEMKAVPTALFVNAVHKAGSHPKTAHIHKAFINDISTDGALYQSSIRLESHFTEWHLGQTGFVWPVMNDAYLKGYIDYFTRIQYWGAQKTRCALQDVNSNHDCVSHQHGTNLPE